MTFCLIGLEKFQTLLSRSQIILQLHFRHDKAFCLDDHNKFFVVFRNLLRYLSWFFVIFGALNFVTGFWPYWPCLLCAFSPPSRWPVQRQLMGQNNLDKQRHRNIEKSKTHFKFHLYTLHLYNCTSIYLNWRYFIITRIIEMRFHYHSLNVWITVSNVSWDRY